MATTLQSHLASGAGAVLWLIRNGEADTRAAIAQRTGLARSTVTQRIDALLDSGLIYEAGENESTGGRPPGRLAFNHGAGIVLRCPGCAALAATIVERDDALLIAWHGVLRVPRPAAA